VLLLLLVRRFTLQVKRSDWTFSLFLFSSCLCKLLYLLVLACLCWYVRRIKFSIATSRSGDIMLGVLEWLQQVLGSLKRCSLGGLNCCNKCRQRWKLVHFQRLEPKMGMFCFQRLESTIQDTCLCLFACTCIRN
jgi:hypothetical protein